MSMADMDTIRMAFERNARVVSRRPEIAQKTYVTRVRIQHGLTCEIEEGPWRLTADLSTGCGGNAAGPTPGTLGRAALGSCLAISYVMWAAQLGVPLTHVAVEVHADQDVRGMYGVDDVPAGYTRVQYVVAIDSPAATEDVMRVLRTAEAHSPYLEVFRLPLELRRTIRLNGVEECTL
jgi:uncharacterized OsmC-like protein